ncbi:MAG: hypothetical protein WBO73_20805 [Gammaproteobacteria bacterium]|jgi:hypothetical protein
MNAAVHRIRYIQLDGKGAVPSLLAFFLCEIFGGNPGNSDAAV